MRSGSHPSISSQLNPEIWPKSRQPRICTRTQLSRASMRQRRSPTLSRLRKRRTDVPSVAAEQIGPAPATGGGAAIAVANVDVTYGVGGAEPVKALSGINL